MSEFEKKFNLKTNFLEYGSFCIKIKEYLGLKDQPMLSPIDPQNSYINILLNMDTKGVSNIYWVMLGKSNNILDEISQKWREKANLELASFLLSKSFRFIPKIDDIYLRYIQYRTLHRRFYTNNVLCKIGIKDTEICNICKTEILKWTHAPILQWIWFTMEKRGKLDKKYWPYRLWSNCWKMFFRWTKRCILDQWCNTLC